MTYLKNFSKSLLFIIGSFLILILLFTILNYFNIINNKILNISKIIIPLFAQALGGFIIGKNTIKNGWFEGLKLGMFCILIVLLFNLFLKYSINSKDLIFYILMLISTILGSMFGINQKTKEK